jgi:hypothetical protein
MSSMNKINSNPSYIAAGRDDQAGFAAIIVTLIIMAVVVLMTVGFVRTVSREQRSSLDRQLSTQAFYAAETGVSDAAEWLENNPNSPVDQCRPSPDPFANRVLSADGQIEYTCVLVNPGPPTLRYDNIGTASAHSITLDTRDEVTGNPVNLTNLRVSWQADATSGGPDFLDPSSIDFPATADLAAPVMRVTLTPLNALSRQELIDNTYTVFLRPVGGAVDSVTGTNFLNGPAQRTSQGNIVNVQCNTGHTDASLPFYCNADITIPSISSQFLMTARGIYGSAQLELSSSQPINFRGEQAIVDSTGRAADVLRRIQVRLPARSQAPAPSFALEAGSLICKPYGVGGGYYTSLDCLIPGPPPPPPPSAACVDPVTFIKKDTVDGTLAMAPIYGWVDRYTIVGANLAACRYDLTMIATETSHAYHASPQIWQDQERFFVEGYAADGTLTFRTKPTDDLPECSYTPVSPVDDPAEYDRCTRIVDSDFVNTEALGLVTDTVIIKHIALWQPSYQAGPGGVGVTCPPGLPNDACAGGEKARLGGSQTIHGVEIIFTPI